MPRLADLTWVELAGPPRHTLIVPVGSVEQHGPHLPLHTDVAVASAVADAVHARDPEVIVAPAVAYGAAGEHEGFPGTISIGHEALRLLLVELGRSACRWAARLVFVNGHGGNLLTVIDAVKQLRYEGRDAAWAACVVAGPRDHVADAHAGRTETSIMLALEPAAVRTDAAVAGNTAPLRELLPALQAGGVAAVSPNGVLGDPAGASADEGAALLAELADTLTAALRQWRPGPDGRLA
ncbi:mycofactocin biosynthesis peptidyl-dipeptidase MftE [Pseudonocardia acidicola]|uniref:Mycofactocin biosynthesis peptidyl-dipeptidase MftE n=1 Tax=Pseudonocardia acidicola TaxID=2724939 RepID=A0ABX1SAD7_9PSEU|nr:mycofactocin biosynthesis peptidyl-dipeptidase MftE [Pseudonocardia acidicola]NMH98070.1 mycofactocin biosynthesis peptidyl-dipeptidase MftE [Pseudonocardia acidicola]